MKKISNLLICLLFVVILAGCGKKEDIQKESIKLSDDIIAIEKTYSNVKKDHLKWDYNETSKTIVISGKGPMKSYSDEEPEWNYLSNEALKVVIGDEITSVGDGAFLYFDKLTEVKFGENIEYIGKSSFDNCISLRTINFSKNLKYIGDYAFNNALLHSANGFILPEGIIYLGNSSFRSAFKESFVSIPKSLTTIEYDAFDNIYVLEFRVDEDNKNYKSIDGVFYDKNITTLINYPAMKTDKIYEIPNTVTTIKKEAIQVTNDLEKIIIPKATTTIEEKSIFWNYGLKYIDVDKENKNYKSVDGVLYSKDGKYLISYPIASLKEEYTVLDTVEEIQMYSISSAKNLKRLYIKNGVKKLNEGSIYLCKNLEEIHLPKSLNKIDKYALEYNDNLKLIKYASTKTDFNKIKIEENNTTLQSNNVKIDYIDKES